jgi:hypothetical protein
MTKSEILFDLQFRTLRNDVRLLKECCEEVLNDKCQWKYAGGYHYFNYKTECKNEFLLADDITEHAYKYCPSCGKQIEDMKYV